MRSKGLGGTDIAALAGLNPWKGPMDVYLEKLGLVDSEPDNEAMYWGRAFEPALQKRYEKETGHKVQSCPMLVHQKHPWYLGSPDGVIYLPDDSIAAGVDYKTTTRRQDYGDPGTDQVPDWVACQCQWYCGLTGAYWWDVAVLFFAPRREFAIYHLERSDVVIDQLTEIGREFWEGHVVPRIPPPIDGSPGAKRYLDIAYPQDQGEMLTANEHAQSVAFQLQSAKERLKMAEQDKALAENFMKEIIQDAAGIQGDGWKVTWKTTKNRQDVDWKAAFYQLFSASHVGQPECDAIIDNHTTTKPGPRVFRLWVKEEK